VSLAAAIVAQREQYGIPQAVSCRALGVSQAWFYKWRRGVICPRRARRAVLATEVARLFKAHHGTYGSPRITADLRDAGWTVSQNTVAAVMREQHLAARRKKRRKATTRPGKGRWRAPDLVGRDFTAQEINQKWFGDGTEIITGQGKLYLASVLDIASRRILGFALSGHHDAQLAYGALAMAAAVRGGQADGVILHTDQGSEGGFNRSSQHWLAELRVAVRLVLRLVSSSRVSCAAAR
jgi:putative transposase